MRVNKKKEKERNSAGTTQPVNTSAKKMKNSGWGGLKRKNLRDAVWGEGYSCNIVSWTEEKEKKEKENLHTKCNRKKATRKARRAARNSVIYGGRKRGVV